MEKVLQLGQNHLKESIRVSGKMISITDRENIFLKMAIVGVVHFKMVEQMALVFLMEKLIDYIALMISCMDMQ